jgi:hypothetical protein
MDQFFAALCDNPETLVFPPGRLSHGELDWSFSGL